MKSVGKWLCLIGIAALLFAIAGCGGKAKEDTEAPVITLSAEVPKSGYNGKTVVLPTATASDNVDGDLTESVKVTVNAYDESGDVKAEPVYNKPANVERTFVPAARYAGYKIIYFVSDAAGNEASLVTEFSAIDDTAPPVLTVNAASNEGITVAADEYFKLPTATGIDKPMDDDITDDIQIMIMDSSNAVVSTFKGGATEHTGRIVEGNYTIVYTLSDGAGNEAESVTLPLIVTAADYSKNLLKAENIVKGNSASFNDYGWLSVGMNSASGTAFDTSCAAFNLCLLYTSDAADD